MRAAVLLMVGNTTKHSEKKASLITVGAWLRDAGPYEGRRRGP